ncbi:hypothetical protein SKDZ_06G0770 [Saccharomyces kudriavzevii ZP591]|nr:hypothetical protein SKDZ_06G0770 [Saccharomyces kudriavzevii ZP591]
MFSFKPVLLFASLLQLLSFLGLLLCCLTSPVIKTWGLAQIGGVFYGAFGYCQSAEVVSCSPVHLMYNPLKVTQPGFSFENWSLNPGARHITGKLLISIPIATSLTFICFLFLLIFFFLYQPGGTYISLTTSNAILQMMTFLSTLLVCVLILARFHPYTTWCGWLTLPCSFLSLIVCVLSVFGWWSVRNQTETVDMEEGIENVESILKLYGASQTSSVLDDKSPEAIKSTAISSSTQSIYANTNISDGLQKTLDPNQDKAKNSNQDEPSSENYFSLKRRPLVNFFIPKLNNAEMFVKMDTEKQEELSLDRIDMASFPARQGEVEVPAEKKMENILFYEGISSHSQRSYDPPWLFGVQAAQAVNDFKAYSQNNCYALAPPQRQLHDPSNYHNQEGVPHDPSFTWNLQQRSMGYYGNDCDSHPIPGIDEHSNQAFSQEYGLQHMLPKKYRPAYKQRIFPIKANPQPAYSFY